MSSVPFIDASAVAAVEVGAAADAIEAALRDGLDPEAEPGRTILPCGDGQMLVMPASVGALATVKIVTVGGDPRIQGIAVVFDTDTLAPLATIDAVALTNLRTPAVSLVAARRLVNRPVRRMVVFGRGPQGRAHAEALRRELGVGTLTTLDSGSSPDEVRAAVGAADLICCATSAREPLFDGTLVADSTVVIAVGSHEPTARELDSGLLARAVVVVESRRTALREAGDLVMAGIEADGMITLAELVGGAGLPAGRPRLFKSTGMSWEDAVVAGAILDSAR